MMTGLRLDTLTKCGCEGGTHTSYGPVWASVFVHLARFFLPCAFFFFVFHVFFCLLVLVVSFLFCVFSCCCCCCLLDGKSCPIIRKGVSKISRNSHPHPHPSVGFDKSHQEHCRSCCIGRATVGTRHLTSMDLTVNAFGVSMTCVSQHW